MISRDLPRRHQVEIRVVPKPPKSKAGAAASPLSQLLLEPALSQVHQLVETAVYPA